MKLVGRQKLTVSLSTKCLELIDKYAETTGFESRSRVIEETVFAISEFQKYRRFYAEKFQTSKPNPSTEEAVGMLIGLADILSKFTGIIDRFDRFPSVQQTQENEPVKYRVVPPERRGQNVKPKG
jgi:hypothetical protein